MTRLLCKVGPAQVPVMGTMYNFALDKLGRAVCDVTITKHVKILMAAGVYARLDDEPEVLTPAQLADPLTAIRAALQTAGSPQVIVRTIDDKPVYYAIAAWPETIAVPDETANALPPFAAFGADASLTFTVANGAATYAFKGKADETALYELAPDSTFEAPPAPEGAPAQAQTLAGAAETGGNDGPAKATGAVVTPPALIDIKGIGRGLIKKLEAEGIISVQQIAELEAPVVAALSKKLKIGDAITRDKWIEQAKALLAPKG